MQTKRINILSLDVGERRIGVARANLIARLPQPLMVLEHTENVWKDIQALVHEQEAAAVVVGWPRGLQGQTTRQTETVENFIQELDERLSVPVYAQDEALTSVQAEKELHDQGKQIGKGMVDALAATYILEDFLTAHKELPI